MLIMLFPFSKKTVTMEIVGACGISLPHEDSF